MSDEGIVKAIEGIGKSTDEKAGVAKNLPNREHFDTLMSQESAPKPLPIAPLQEKIEAVAKLSPMEEISKLNTRVDAITKGSSDEIRSKAHQLIADIDEVNKKFSGSTQTSLSPSYNTLLKNRLSHIDDNLKIALTKAGLEHTAAPTAVAGSPPLTKFLGYLTHAQHQLENLDSNISSMHAKGLSLNPLDMFTIQMKMSQIQQEVEFFTNALNKALESTKTVMNVQV